MAKTTREHKPLSNLLDRKFDQGGPGKVLLTNIKYVYFGSAQPVYLSCIKDTSTNEIVTCKSFQKTEDGYEIY